MQKNWLELEELHETLTRRERKRRRDPKRFVEDLWDDEAIPARERKIRSDFWMEDTDYQRRRKHNRQRRDS